MRTEKIRFLTTVIQLIILVNLCLLIRGYTDDNTQTPNQYKTLKFSRNINLELFQDSFAAGDATAVIELSTTTLSPTATTGSNATSESFNISNSGTGSLGYTITDNVAWLSCSPTSGTVSASYVASNKGPNNKGLRLGGNVKGYTETLKLPPIIYYADPVPNKMYVPPRVNTLTNKVASKTASATISVDYNGFSTEAQTAFQYAVDIWEKQISSSVTININANWTSLGPGVLGSCGPTGYQQNFANAPQANTWYPIALAEAIAGSDLNAGADEMDANFNSDFSNWYYGTDGNCPVTDYDLVTTILHEICHGLGFLGTWSYSSGQGSWGSGTNIPLAYDRFIYNGSGQQLIDTNLFSNPSAELGVQITSGNIFFNGTNTSNASIYAPSTWSGGSSMAHLAESYNGTTNALMTYSGAPGEAIHSPGPIVLNIFKDIGWTVDDSSSGSSDKITVTYDTSTLDAGTYTGIITISNDGNTADTATVTVSLTVSGTGTSQVSIGSEFQIKATDLTTASITEFEKKPKVYVLDSKNKKKSVKVLTKTYPASTIDCEWKKKLVAGKYSLYVQPKAKGVKYAAESINDDFNVMDPDIDDTQGSGTEFTAIDTIITSKGDTFYTVQADLVGNFFGTKKPKAYFQYTDANGRTKKKKFKVSSNLMNVTTGASSCTAVAKKVPANVTGDVFFVNKIGTDTTSLTTTFTSQKKFRK